MFPQKGYLKDGIALVMFCVCTLLYGADALVLAERGKAAEYSIVVPATALPSQRYAAEELRDFSEKVTGVKLPIVTDATRPVPPSAKAIVLEVADATKRVPPTDGFRLKADGKQLRIIGENGRGVLYGAYEVLERFAGCRWYASWHSIVPRRDRIEIPANLDEVHDPAFAMREPYWYDVVEHPEFAARLRVNSRSWKSFDEKYGGNPYRFGGGLGSCHTFETLLPPDKYFDEHPEYFSMVNGRRNRERPFQPCLTNPDVLRVITSNVLERIRKDPGARFYGVSQNDWKNYCECPNCKAVDDEEESHAGTIVRFVNAVAEAVEKEFPDATIETLAYQYTQKAPKKTKLRHNVVPCLCTVECDFSQSIDKSPYKENIAFRKDIEDWSRMTDFLYVWDYTTDFSHYTLPWPNVYALQGNIQFFRRHNVKALFAQGAYNGRHADFAELKAWLLAKWMWNPDLPMKPLLDDFFAGYYGKGAPFVREYFEKIHRLQAEHSAKSGQPLLIFAGVENPAIPDSFLVESAMLWDKAVAAVADDPATSYNVRMSKFSFDYVRLERSRKLLNLTKAKPIVSPEMRKRIARSLLDRMDEAKDLRLAESDRTALVREWKEIAEGDVVQNQSDSGVLEDRLIPIINRGKWGDYVDDPLAEDGKALKLFNTNFNWCAQLRMGKIAFEPGKKYRLRIRVRVDKAHDGEAFKAGVYSNNAKCSRGDIHVRTSEVGDGYAWYDVATWVPAPDELFWMGPGRFNADNTSAVNGIYIDKMEFVVCTVGSKTSVQASQVEWPMDELRKPPKVYDASAYKTNGVEVAFLEGLPWRGHPTRIFCYYGVPSHPAGEKVPGVVLVHGGGGSAFCRWVKFWNERGYAAVSIDTCGCVSGNTVGSEQRGHFRHAYGGPEGWGGFNQLDESIADQWMYHAVADAIVANSFLRSLSDVDPGRIGITGVSWGGVITCIAATQDNRFCFAAPVYGCGGFLRNSPMWKTFVADMGESRVSEWEALWDPLQSLPGLNVPILWLTGTNDRAFSIPALMKSYTSVSGEKHLSLKVGLEHTHGAVSEQAAEVVAFADSMCRGGRRLADFAPIEFCRESRHASCKVRCDAPPKEVSLVYSDDANESWEKRKWKSVTAKFEPSKKRVEASVPVSARAFFFNVITAESLVTSSEIVEKP